MCILVNKEKSQEVLLCETMGGVKGTTLTNIVETTE